MSVKVVVGAQKDSLEGIEKFGGDNGTVVFPHFLTELENACLLYTSPSPRDRG